MVHPFQRRLLAESLTRVRRAGDRARYAASQRQARIDPNPHQIDAAIFALRRLGEGGCILADEVGLGKTIEAGLVIAQRRAEGASRVLLVVPKALIGQWQAEMLNLFGMEVREEQLDFAPAGVYVVGREFAGGVRGAERIGAAPPFDLVVIDEAHEIFAGIHRRYGRNGLADEASGEAMTAHRVRELLRGTPVLLLTATPIQNSLVELWGLVQYVEPTGTLLGDIATFREVFCAGDDRTLVAGQEHELRRRLAMVCQRTLRRQAAEFLERPFMQRQCRLYEYPMSEDERTLYDDVTEYLLEPSLYAFAGRHRRLLLIGFHRRMASSLWALAASLEGVARRLRGILEGRIEVAVDDDLEDLEDLDPETEEQVAPPASRDGIASELARVEAFAARARALPTDAKARTFQDAIRLILAAGAREEGSGKAVVFTESITTQDYLRTLLLEVGLRPDEITLFSGTNDQPRAREALARWQREVGDDLAARPSRDVAVRMALVHEFQHHSRVMVCTEAGAKGLNLQFCETVINYDLPWNPQRIEQRIGRCHRYSQQRDVLVVNFLARDNEAHRLTFEILSQKLDLFGRVLDASDRVLHEPRTDAPESLVSAVAVELQSDLRDIWSRSRTIGEATAHIASLRDRMDERREAFEREVRRTSALIESRFDDEIKRAFRDLRDELPRGLAAFDRDVAALVGGYLEGRVGYERAESDGRVTFTLPEGRFATGDPRGLTDAEGLSRDHPLVVEALAAARSWAGGPVALVAPELEGRTGVLVVCRVHYDGFLPVERIVAAAVIDGEAVDPTIAASLLGAAAADLPGLAVEVDEALLDDAVEEAIFLDQQAIEAEEQAHFERALGQLERYVGDKALVEKRASRDVVARLRAARERRDGVVGTDARARVEGDIARLAERGEALEARIRALDSRQDEDYRKWRDHYHALRYRAPTITRLMRIPFRGSPC